MEIPNKALVLIIIASMAVGVAIEKQLTAVKKETETKTIENDITTIIKERQNKDGSIEKDTTIVDKSKQQEQKSTVTSAAAPDWIVQGSVGLDSSVNTVYTISINRRILGPIYIGAWGSTQKSVGLSLAIPF